MNKTLESIFETLGLSKVELKIYMGLLKDPCQSIHQISVYAGLTRTNTYNYLEKLSKMGLIHLVPESKTTKYSPANPESIKTLLELRNEEINNQTKDFKKIQTELLNINKNNQTPTYVKYYRGEQGIIELVKEALKFSSLDSIYNTDPDVSTYPSVRKLLEKELSKNKITHIRTLRSIKYKKATSKPFAKSKNFEIRYLPKEFQAESRVILVKDNVFLIKSSNPMLGVKITCPEIYDTQQALFDLAWKHSSK